MKRLLTTILPLLLSVITGSAATSAADILAKCAAKIKSTPSLYVT